MQLLLRNIGPIEKIDVAVEGITIIGGENNTGKSTIGKAIFACFQNMAYWGEIYSDYIQARIDKLLEIESTILEDFCMKQFKVKRRRTSKVAALRKDYSVNEEFRIAIEDFQVAVDECDLKNVQEILNVVDESILHKLKMYLSDYYDSYIAIYAGKQELSPQTLKKRKNDWIQKVVIDCIGLEMDEVESQEIVIKASFENVFKGQYMRLDCQEAIIHITDDEGRVVEMIFSPDKLSLSAPIRTTSNVYYMESPKIYDLLSKPLVGMDQQTFLKLLMSPNFIERNPLFYSNLRKKDSSLEMNNTIGADPLLNHIREVIGGQAEYYQKVGVEFKDRQYTSTIHPQNVSTGLKAMALFEYALRIGLLLPGDVLILDEPEINLHPKWQIEYAKTLVELQKRYHLKIIISSHSPYFIRAIEIFSDKEQTMESLNVYMTERNAKNSTIGKNLSYSEYGMSELYDLLAAPLDELENLLED